MPSSEVMKKFTSGKLRSGGPGGPVVKNPLQAVAIKYSEERAEAKHGGRYPEKKRKKGKSRGQTKGARAHRDGDLIRRALETSSTRGG